MLPQKHVYNGLARPTDENIRSPLKVMLCIGKTMSMPKVSIRTRVVTFNIAKHFIIPNPDRNTV